MIAAVKGWQAALPALLFFISPGAYAADDPSAAARELARRTAFFVGRGEPVSIVWRNASSLGSAESAQARAAFEAALKEAGARASDIAPLAEVRMTVSENQSQYLLVEEIRKGDDRQVWIAACKRSAPPPLSAAGVSLDKKLLWEQDEPILDAAFRGDAWLMLSASKVTMLTRQNGRWEPKSAAPVSPARPLPRDPRGRLRLSGSALYVYLPGTLCRGTIDPAPALECSPTEDAWVLESGSSALLLASFAAGRNYFDGRVTTQTGLRKTVPPFFSAAAVEEQGRALWLLALVDGRTEIFDGALESVGAITSWGSDIAGVDAHCAGGAVVLATRPGDGAAPDAIQAFAIVSRAAVPLTVPIDLPGPVVALWPSGGTSAVAVVRELAGGKYQAYVVTVACGG